MLAYGQRINRHRVEMQALVDYWCDRIEHLLRACERDRELLPEAQSIDVPFDQFFQCIQIQLAVLKRRDEGRHRTFKHFHAPCFSNNWPAIGL